MQSYYFSEPHVQDFWPESSSVEKAHFSDEEVMLASNNPKKRAGRKKFRETRHPVYRGVRRRDSGKWVCEVREPNKKSRIWLGTFPTPEMAARAHDVAAIALRGRSACLNFADSAWRLPVPASVDAKEIRKTAAEAAEAFRPQSSESGGGAKEEPSAAVESPEEFSLMDDEALYGMHGLLDDMAEGLLLPPPQYSDDVEINADVSLWSYSFNFYLIMGLGI
ncbi:UNVERIFIED_CONTAM: Dehydration-responsive element-binding protein 1D [Sesamum radiatum]|uniref:Dehydration-responsive element-binding protein 1D n=1 Tax=Sesamum radiatum TaxID=300843 RepID=A0AAW2TE42_SESRA